MDIATILGILLSFILVSFAILGTSFDWMNLDLFIHGPSMLIVFGGTFGATLANYPLSSILQVGKVIGKTFFIRLPSTDMIISQFMDYSNRARREGLLALEPALRNIDDIYLKKGLQLTVDGLEPEAIQSILEAEIDNIENRHSIGIDIMQSLAAYAPALGMIGTVIGLIQMLRDLNDVAKIGPSMALALITTFYGAILANLVFLPLAGKLRQRSREEILIKEMQMEGVLGICKGENPRIIMEKLTSFQPAGERKRVD